MNPAALNSRPKRPATSESAKVFTIAAGLPFTDALAAGIRSYMAPTVFPAARAMVIPAMYPQRWSARGRRRAASIGMGRITATAIA